MKTIKLISLLAAMFISANIMASNPNVKVLSNIENTSMGYTKVLTSYDEITSTPLQKVSYQYDNSDNILEKVVYKWSGKQGWVGSQKINYQYNAQNEPVSIVYTKWDNKAKSWSNKSEQMNYSYCDEGNVSVSVSDVK